MRHSCRAHRRIGHHQQHLYSLRSERRQHCPRHGERHRRHFGILYRWRPKLERHTADLQPNRTGTDHSGQCIGRQRLPQQHHASRRNGSRHLHICSCRAHRRIGHHQQHLYSLRSERRQHCPRHGERYRRHFGILYRWRPKLERHTADLQPNRTGTDHLGQCCRWRRLPQQFHASGCNGAGPVYTSHSSRYQRNRIFLR